MMRTCVLVACFCVIPACAGRSPSDAIKITNERLLARTEMVVDANDVCSEQDGLYRLAVAGKHSTEKFGFRLENLSASPMFVDLMQNAEGYWTDYPNVRLLFRSENARDWGTPVMAPGEFDFTGLERIAIEPGGSVFFNVPVVGRLRKSSRSVKLQLNFYFLENGAISAGCISSATFSVVVQDRVPSIVN